MIGSNLFFLKEQAQRQMCIRDRLMIGSNLFFLKEQACQITYDKT